MAVAMQWVSQITTASLMLALPVLGGYWLDVTWHVGPWMLIAGALLGLIAFFFRILTMTGVLNSGSSPRSGRGKHRHYNDV